MSSDRGRRPQGKTAFQGESRHPLGALRVRTPFERQIRPGAILSSRLPSGDPPKDRQRRLFRREAKRRSSGPQARPLARLPSSKADQGASTHERPTWDRAPPSKGAGHRDASPKGGHPKERSSTIRQPDTARHLDAISRKAVPNARRRP
jgi:hypothetical protein